MKILTLSLCLTLAALSGHAHAGTEWEMLNQQAMGLYQQRDYARATVVAKKALQESEQVFGPDHPDVATSLHNLAALYNAQGQYAQAELLYKRALGYLGEGRRPGSSERGLEP